MLNIKRQILIGLLNQHHGLTSKELATQLQVTQRTIRNNIEQINQNFKQDVIGYQKPYFKINDPKTVIDYMTKRQKEDHYPNYTGDRPFLVYLNLYQNSWVKIADLMEQLHVGRNEIEKALKSLKRQMPAELMLITTKYGVYLAGDLLWQNYFLATLAVKRISRLVSNQYLRLIFHDNFKQTDFKNYLNALALKVKTKQQIALNDKSLYILTIMHFLAAKDSALLAATNALQAEYILYSNNFILHLPDSQRALYEQLLELHPDHQYYLQQGLGNLAQHLLLAQTKTKYFHLNVQKTTIDGITIAYTKQDELFMQHLQTLQDKVLRQSIVIYDPDSLVLSHYQDQLMPLAKIFPELAVKTTNNLFELDQLLHVKQTDIIFTAKQERISLPDQKYQINYVHLDENTKLTIIHLLLKGTH